MSLSGTVDPEKFLLCYVNGPWAWFTTSPVHDQWGDDWNDAPYEHNAGSPYEWMPYMQEKHGQEPYELRKVAWEGPLETPADHTWPNSPWSVEDINHGKTAWLASGKWINDGLVIMAGVSFPRFIALVEMAGGHVYVRFG